MRHRLALCLMCVVFVCHPAMSQEKSAPKRTLTPESFLDLRMIQDPQFSPDGTRLVFVVTDPLKGEKRNSHLWIYDRSTSVTRQLTDSAKSETYPRWSPDGKTLAFLSNRAGEQQQIYLLRLAGGEAYAVTKDKASVSALAWSPDGQSLAYLAPDPKSEAEEKKEQAKDDARVIDKDDKKPRLRILDLSKNESHALTPAGWEVEELSWLPDSHSLVVKANRRPASDQFTSGIYLVPLDGAQKELRAPHGPLGRVRVSPSGKWIGFTAAREDGPVPHDLWIMPVEGGASRNLTATTLDRAIEDFYWTTGNSLAVLYAQGFRNKLTFVSPGDSQTSSPDFPANLGPFALASSGEIVFVGNTSTTPQELWLRDAQGRTQQATHLNAGWESFGLVAPELFHYKSFDGVEIEAALLKPPAYDGKSKLPTIVLVHGGPTGNWEDSIDSWGQLLVAHGYAVLYPNVRGSIGYGDAFVKMNRADWGGADFKDVMAGVNDVVGKGIADSNKLGIGGWSYGGYMTEWAVTQTDIFRAAVSGAGMANLISEYGTEEDPAYDEWFFGLPYETADRFLNSSPVLRLKHAKTPTLILQGEADPIDAVGQSQELYRGLKRYGVETELVIYPREPHGFHEAHHRTDVLQRMLAWYEKYIPPDK
ncbi:MAG TPA: S9 family peptidase [Candidatus Saccharimonadales bacterium]|nr:S9 family peptidase [Candidatus Saccharimonadales bacterium]